MDQVFSATAVLRIFRKASAKNRHHFRIPEALGPGPYTLKPHSTPSCNVEARKHCPCGIVSMNLQRHWELLAKTARVDTTKHRDTKLNSEGPRAAGRRPARKAYPCHRSGTCSRSLPERGGYPEAEQQQGILNPIMTKPQSLSRCVFHLCSCASLA